jgi:hypothetical protein
VLQNGKYVIQGIEFGIDKRIPIGLKITDNVIVKFDLADVVNFDTNQDVFIYDSMDDSYHNLKTESYSVSLNTGVYDNRFQITFRGFNLSSNSRTIHNFVITQINTRQILTISNPNSVDLKSVTLYDISGKVIFEQKALGRKSLLEFPTGNLNEGVYIVKIEPVDDYIVTQKIIVENQK